MHNTILLLHFGCAALWLGCVITEALFERALLASDRTAHLVLADLHVRVDKVVELPALTLVLLSGIALWHFARPEGAAFYWMVGAGLLAIIANLWCVKLVFKRRDAAHEGDWTTFERLDHLQHKIGAVVLIGLLVAIVAGAGIHS